MPTKIEIKPNDQSWVGKKIRVNYWDKSRFFTPGFIGEKYMVGIDEGNEQVYSINLHDHGWYWELYEEPKEEKEGIDPYVYNTEIIAPEINKAKISFWGTEKSISKEEKPIQEALTGIANKYPDEDNDLVGHHRWTQTYLIQFFKSLPMILRSFF